MSKKISKHVWYRISPSVRKKTRGDDFCKKKGTIAGAASQVVHWAFSFFFVAPREFNAEKNLACIVENCQLGYMLRRPVPYPFPLRPADNSLVDGSWNLKMFWNPTKSCPARCRKGQGCRVKSLFIIFPLFCFCINYSLVGSLCPKGAGGIQPWNRFVNGHQTTKLICETTIFSPEQSGLRKHLGIARTGTPKDLNCSSLHQWTALVGPQSLLFWTASLLAMCP